MPSPAAGPGSRLLRSIEERPRGSQAFAQFRIAEKKVDLFFGEIDGRFDVGAESISASVRPCTMLEIRPQGHGGAGRYQRSRIDEVGDGFGLRQVDVVVKCALREFARPRRRIRAGIAR
jgi:hypothetical protein